MSKSGVDSFISEYINCGLIGAKRCDLKNVILKKLESSAYINTCFLVYDLVNPRCYCSI